MEHTLPLYGAGALGANPARRAAARWEAPGALLFRREQKAASFRSYRAA